MVIVSIDNSFRAFCCKEEKKNRKTRGEGVIKILQDVSTLMVMILQKWEK